MTIESTLQERGARYGEFEDHARLSQRLKHVMRTGRNWEGLACDQKEALEMIQHKVARILNGEPDYIDSWTDIQGYARLLEQRLEKEQSK